MARCSLDNLTAILIGFEGLASFLETQRAGQAAPATPNPA